ncbi:MAG: NUDIX hydrolase [Chloroflexota bacterium]|nr:NUDIX hydrolase [Chloroflexota bacterium]
MSKTNTPWQTLDTTRLWESKWYNLRQDRVRIHTGDEVTYTFQEHPGAVFIVPVTTDGKLVLVHQYRHPVGEWLWEVPAGAVDGNEDLESAARRELAEEIGGTARELRYVGHFFSASSISNLRINVFLATGVEVEQSEREATELIELTVVPVVEALEMAKQGKIKDGQSALALLLCEPLLLVVRTIAALDGS